MSRRIKVKYTKFDIAKTLGPAISISAVSNAAEAVASVADTTAVEVGDFVFIDSKWTGLRHRVARIKAIAAGASVTLEGVNTVDVIKYPPGAGAGTLRKIIDWERFGDIKSFDSAGGEAKFADGTTIDDENDIEIPNGRSAARLTLTVYDDADDTMPAVIEAAERAGTPVPMRMTAAAGVQTVVGAYWSISDGKADGDWVTRQVIAAYAARPQRYVA